MIGLRIVGPMTRISHQNRPSWNGPRTFNRGTFYPLVIDLTGNSLSGTIWCLYQVAIGVRRTDFPCKGRKWAHQDLNLGPTDYESAALTN